MTLFEKFGHHQALNRLAGRYAKKGIETGLSAVAAKILAVI